MWLPPNKLYTVENFSRHTTGEQDYTDFDAQNDIGGVVSLRNIATGTSVVVPAGEPWPGISWDETYDFASLWSVHSGDFGSSGNIPIQNLSFGTVGILGNAAIYKTGDIDTRSGHLIEGSFLVTRLTGSVSTGQNFYGVYFEYTGEGYDSVSLSDDPPGFVVGKGLSHETFVPATGLSSQVIGFRYGVKGETGHFITTDGTNVLITGRSAGSTQLDGVLTGHGYPNVPYISILGDITFSANVDADARIELGKYNRKSPVTDIAGDFIADTAYSTGDQVFTTEPFKPFLPISEWGTVAIDTNGTNGGGETAVSIVFTNDDWTTSGETSQQYSGSTTGLHTFDIGTGVVITNPEQHAIKFNIYQHSTNGEAASPAINYISLGYKTADGRGLVNLDPIAGAAAGEYPVLITMDPTDRSYITPPTGGIFRVHLFHQSAVRELESQVVGTVGRANLGRTGVFGEVSYSINGFSGVTDGALTGFFGSSNLIVPGPPGTFLQTHDYELIFPTGTLTGLPTAISGSILDAWNMTGSTLGPASNYSTDIVQFTNSTNTNQSYDAQKYKGVVGNGWETPLMTGNSGDLFVVVDAVIQVEQGGVAVCIDSGNAPANDPIFTSNRYKETQRIKTVLPRNTGGYQLRVYGTDEDGVFTGSSQCEYTIADLTVHGLDDANPTYWSDATIAGGHNFSGDWSIEAWVGTHGHAHGSGEVSDSYLINIAGDQDLGIGMDRFGKPKVYYRDDTATHTEYEITGAFGFDTTRWFHVEAVRRDEHLELYLNGELAAIESGTTMAVDSMTGVALGKGLVLHVSDARISTGSKHPMTVSALDAFHTPPRFQTEYQFPTGGSHFLYRLDEGSTFDSSSNRNDLIFPEAGFNRENIDYADGVFGEGIQLYADSYGSTYKDMDFTGDAFLSAYVAKPTSTNRATIASGSNWAMYFSGDYLCMSKDSNILVSSVEFSTFQYFPFAVDMYTGGGNLMAVGYYNTGQSLTGDVMFSGDLGATSTDVVLSGCMHLGHDTRDPEDRGVIFIDELGLWSGRYTGETGSWLAWDVAKEAPQENVYINGVAIDTGRVRHIGIYDKEIVMPPMTDFTATGSLVRISVDTYAGRLSAKPLFQYAGARKVVIDTGDYELWTESRDKICKTKSPFRIGQQVPEAGVNLAFIQGPTFSTQNNLSIVSNAGQVSDNHVSSLRAYDIHSAPTGDVSTGSGANSNYYLTGEIDTDEVLITTWSMQRKDTDLAAPLFYKYKMGGDDFYLHQVGATGNIITGDYASMIRENINLTDQDGESVSIDEFPWDIRISKIRNDGFRLPNNVFNVELLTRDRYLPNRSLFVQYNGADPSNQWAQVKGLRECINVEPIWFHSQEEKDISETFTTSDNIRFTDIGSANFNQGPLVQIRPIGTGQWSPEDHRDLIIDDEFLS